MPYQPPPTFTDGQVLSASALNILADNQQYFAGLSGAVNPAFVAIVPAMPADLPFYARRRNRWLVMRYSYSVDTGWVDHIYAELQVNGVVVWSQDGLTGSGFGLYVNIDLDAMATPPGTGTWYQIKFVGDYHDSSHVHASYSGTTSFVIEHLFESPEMVS